MSERKGRFRPAGIRVGDREIETTASEKVLAVVLAVFIAIGAVWGYIKLDEVAQPDSTFYAPDRELLDRAEISAIQDHRQAVRSVGAARVDRRAATRQLELRREAYRTALDADEPSAELGVEYESAQAKLAAASRELAAAAAVEARTRPAAAVAQQQLTELRQVAAERDDADHARHDRIVFFLRMALLILMLGGAYRLLGRLRSRHSRYLPAALAWIGATAVLAVVMAGDYTDSYHRVRRGRASGDLDRRNRPDLGCVCGPAALSRETCSSSAGSSWGVSVLRIPPRRQASLRGVWPSGDRQLLELPGRPPSRYASLRILWQRLVRTVRSVGAALCEASHGGCLPRASMSG